LEPEKESASPPRISLWPLAFVGILVSLLASLVSAKVKNNHQAIHPRDSTDPKGNTAPQQVSFIPNTIPSPQQANSPDGGQRRTPGWEKAAVLVALGILGVNAWQSYETRKSAGAAKSAAETAQKQLEISDRPWMKDLVKADSALTFDNKGNANLTIIGSAKNIGHSVATGVTMNAQWIALPMDEYFTEPTKRQTEFCDKIAKTQLDPMKWGAAVFPDDHADTRMTLSISRKDIDASRVPFKGQPGKNFGSFIVGCIDYQYSSSTQRHQTRFVYDVFCLNPKEPNHASVVEIDRTWPPETLIIELHHFSGKYAY
jgi:hypothetical protein